MQAIGAGVLSSLAEARSLIDELSPFRSFSRRRLENGTGDMRASWKPRPGLARALAPGPPQQMSTFCHRMDSSHSEKDNCSFFQ